MHDPPSITALVNAAPMPGPALAKVVPLAPSQDRVAVYLARLGSPKSRRTMRAALATVAALGRALDYGRLSLRAHGCRGEPAILIAPDSSPIACVASRAPL